MYPQQGQEITIQTLQVYVKIQIIKQFDYKRVFRLNIIGPMT